MISKASKVVKQIKTLQNAPGRDVGKLELLLKVKEKQREEAKRIEDTYKEVIRQFKRQHSNRLPWRGGGGSRKLTAPKDLLRKLAEKELQAVESERGFKSMGDSRNRLAWYNLLQKYSSHDKQRFPFKPGPELYKAMFPSSDDAEE